MIASLRTLLGMPDAAVLSIPPTEEHPVKIPELSRYMNDLSQRVAAERVASTQAAANGDPKGQIAAFGALVELHAAEIAHTEALHRYHETARYSHNVIATEVSRQAPGVSPDVVALLEEHRASMGPRS